MSDIIIASVIAGTFGLIGAAGGVCGTLYVTARRDRIEEQRQFRELRMRDRQQFRELGVKVGLTNLDYCMKIAQAAANKFGERFDVPPLKTFVIQGIKQMEVISDPHLTAEEMARKLAECEDFAQAINRKAQERK